MTEHINNFIQNHFPGLSFFERQEALRIATRYSLEADLNGITDSRTTPICLLSNKSCLMRALIEREPMEVIVIIMANMVHFDRVELASMFVDTDTESRFLQGGYLPHLRSLLEEPETPDEFFTTLWLLYTAFQDYAAIPELRVKPLEVVHRAWWNLFTKGRYRIGGFPMQMVVLSPVNQARLRLVLGVTTPENCPPAKEMLITLRTELTQSDLERYILPKEEPADEVF